MSPGKVAARSARPRQGRDHHVRDWIAAALAATKNHAQTHKEQRRLEYMVLEVSCRQSGFPAAHAPGASGGVRGRCPEAEALPHLDTGQVQEAEALHLPVRRHKQLSRCPWLLPCTTPLASPLQPLEAIEEYCDYEVLLARENDKKVPDDAVIADINRKKVEARGAVHLLQKLHVVYQGDRYGCEEGMCAECKRLQKLAPVRRAPNQGDDTQKETT